MNLCNHSLLSITKLEKNNYETPHQQQLYGILVESLRFLLENSKVYVL